MRPKQIFKVICHNKLEWKIIEIISIVLTRLASSLSLSLSPRFSWQTAANCRKYFLAKKKEIETRKVKHFFDIFLTERTSDCRIIFCLKFPPSPRFSFFFLFWKFAMEIHWFIKLFKKPIEMNKTFIEGAGIKQLATINFTHSLLDYRRDSLIQSALLWYLSSNEVT